MVLAKIHKHVKVVTEERLIEKIIAIILYLYFIANESQIHQLFIPPRLNLYDRLRFRSTMELPRDELIPLLIWLPSPSLST